MKRVNLLVILFFLVFLAGNSIVSAQNRFVTGKVSGSDTGETLPTASVVVKGANRGSITDMNGNFRIEIQPGDAILVFSFVGYETQEVEIGNRDVINVVLKIKSSTLEEVVVIGYGTVRKSDLTGSVSSVKSRDLTKVTSLNPEQSLQGRVAGVQVSSTSGAPGATPSVRIRGVGTFNNSSPIYVVDGVILDDISFLNSADIESMEILKDASATAIYGSRGANGVILITTKSGTIGQEKINFSYSGEKSYQILSKKIDLLNGREFATIANEIPGGLVYNNIDKVPDTDWQDLIFNVAPIQNHQLAAWGASKRSTFYIGLGYFKHDGIINKSGYERVSLKLNNSYYLFDDHIKLGNNITISPYKQQNEPGVVFQAYRAWPTLLPYREDGTFAGVPGVGNPLANIEYNNSTNKGVRAVGNIFAEGSFLKRFTAKTSLGIDAGYNKGENYSPQFTVLYYDGTESMQKHSKSSLFKGRTDNVTWLWENTLTYNQSFKKHSINAVAGYTMQNTGSEYLNASGENIIRDASDFWYLQYNNISGTGINGSFNNGVEGYYSMISYLARANYTYNNKYILTATFRRDGSSKFASENRFGNFPSFAAGWNVSQEPFMKNVTEISKLKVRASWGKIGNEKIAYANRFSLTEDLVTVFGKGDLIYPGVTYARSGNPDLRWEVTSQSDVGLELGLFNNKLTGEFDFYNRITDDILVDLSTPGYLGNGQGQKITYNAGKVLNRGYEANINWRDKIGKVSYSIGIVGSTIHNEVLSVGGNSGIDSLLFGGNIKGFLTQSREGLPIGAFYGYKTDGVFQNADDLAAYPHLGDAGVGDLRFVDVNGDHVINDQDRTYLGSPIPEFIFGFNAEVSYRSFDFSFSFQGQTGNKIFNAKEFIRPDAYNYEQHVMDRWTGEGTSTTEPRVSNGGYNYTPSDKFIQDGSFVRLRTVELGYTLPESVSRKTHFQFRIYVKGNNLFTVTKFTGYTPEIGSGDVLSNGIDTGIYPITAIYSVGLNLTF